MVLYKDASLTGGNIYEKLSKRTLVSSADEEANF